MIAKERILESVINATKKVVSDNQIAKPETVNNITHLYGKSGILDSLGLVQLIAEIEDEVYNLTGKSITIADERAMSSKFSPFRSISSLADYVEVLLTEQSS